jgi:hypothetical protein
LESNRRKTTPVDPGARTFPCSSFQKNTNQDQPQRPARAAQPGRQPSAVKKKPGKPGFKKSSSEKFN